MEVKEIVGIDFSKDKFDAYCRKCDSYMVFNNTKEGFRQFKKWIQKLLGKHLSDVFIVMEHTGMYTHLFEQYLHKENLSFTKQPGYAIKHSLGIVRGKSDKKDAKRISEYGWDQRTKLQPLPAESKEMIRLKHLISLRDKFVADRAGYLARLPEQQVFLDLSDSDEMVLTQKAMIAAFDKNIKRAETAIQKTIAKDEKMATSYKLLTSIKGVGPVIATYTIAYTGNFSKFKTARQFACYAGIAPFPYDSGTSVKRKTKVSHFAMKKLKNLLYMGASSAVQCDQELKAYYQRRLAAGKSKMSTLNIVKNKIVYRMFAVIARQSEFETEWKPTVQKKIEKGLVKP
jgi:transposase